MATVQYDPFAALKAGGKFKVSEAAQAAKEYGIYGKANKLWTNYYEPQFTKYNDALDKQLQIAYERSLADARGKLGYGLSMSGSGEGGLAEASRLALTTEAQNKRMDIKNDYTKRVEAAYYQFMTTKDQQAFEMAKMGADYEYRRKLSEMNEPSWWESLGQIVGMGYAMFRPI